MACSVDDSYDACRKLARRTARNFYYSFLTLPRERRRAMCALYAFMRVTDDLGDSSQSELDRRAALAVWRQSLTAACETGESEHPVLPALVDVVRRYGIPIRYLHDVISGVEMDLGPVAYESFEQLARYCYHVAGAVGLACIHLWGFHDQRAEAAAIECGMAFQLTNILRDLPEDAARGRVYIPREDLARFDVLVEELAAPAASNGQRNERFETLMRFEVARAREHYARAQPLSGYLEPAGRPILEAMQRIYGGLLDEIERRGYDVFTRRIELSPLRKFCVAAHTIVRHKWHALLRRR